MAASSLQKPKRELAPITGVSVGAPVRVSSLARLLLQLHHQPALRLVADDKPSLPVPSELEGPE
jgi:hypothetical protein